MPSDWDKFNIGDKVVFQQEIPPSIVEVAAAETTVSFEELNTVTSITPGVFTLDLSAATLDEGSLPLLLMVLRLRQLTALRPRSSTPEQPWSFRSLLDRWHSSLQGRVLQRSLSQESTPT